MLSSVQGMYDQYNARLAPERQVEVTNYLFQNRNRILLQMMMEKRQAQCMVTASAARGDEYDCEALIAFATLA